MSSRWPDFYVIGAMKAGTTTLHDYLVQHPSLFMVKPKEPGYFSQPNVFARGDDWYLSLFSSAAEHQLWGDGSTCYSRWPTYPEVPQRIHERNPDSKFIYVVRDPVSRAYSHYRHRMEEAALGGERIITFAEAIEQDEEMLYAGRYADQLACFFEFFPSDQFFIYDFERLKTNPTELLKEIGFFLGLSSAELGGGNFKRSNEAGEVYARSTINRVLKSFRRLPVLRNGFDLLPPQVRKMMLDSATSAANGMGVSGHLAKSYVDSIPKAEPQDIERLVGYYRGPNLQFSGLTGISIDHWQ